MKRRIAILILAMGMCMGLATRASVVSLAQSQDEKMQSQDSKMNDHKDKMSDKAGKKKSKKHKKDKMDKMDSGKMDEQKN